MGDKTNTKISRLRHLLYGVCAVFVWQSFAMASTCEKLQNKITRAMFSTKIENLEPVNRVLILDNSVRQIHFFTDLYQLEGHTITHRWEFEGRVVNHRDFVINKPRLRASSRLDLDPSMIGRWTVVVTDEDGCPLKAVVFQYVQHTDKQKQTAILPP